MASAGTLGTGSTLYKQGSSTASNTEERPTRSAPPGPMPISAAVSAEGTIPVTIESLEALQTVLKRLDGLAYLLGAPSGDGDGLPPYVAEFEQIISENLPQVLELGEQIEAKHVAKLQSVIDEVIKVIRASGSCRRPADKAEWDAALAEVIKVEKKFRKDLTGPQIGRKAQARENTFMFHYRAINFFVEMCLFPRKNAPTEGLGPYGFAKDTFEGPIMNNINKLQMAANDLPDEQKRAHKAFGNALKILAGKIIEFLEAFKVDFPFNAQGGPISEFSDSGGASGSGATESKENEAMWDEAALVAGFQSVVERLESASGKLRGMQGDGDGPPPYVTEYEQIVNDGFAKILAAAEGIGAEHVPLVRDAYEIALNMVRVSPDCPKPDIPAIQTAFGSVQAIVSQFYQETPPRGFGDRKLADGSDNPLEKEYMMCKKMVEMCVWPLVTQEVFGMVVSAKLSTDIDEMKGFMNQGRRKAKGLDQGEGDKYRAFYDACDAFSTSQLEYVKQYFRGGLDWNPKGEKSLLDGLGISG